MRTSTLAVVLLTLAAAAPAAGKGISSAEICGGDACRVVDGETALALTDGSGGTTAPPSTAAPYYVTRLTIEHGESRDTFQVVFVPSAGLTRGSDGTWMTVADQAAARRLVRNLDPYPASRPLPATERAGRVSVGPSRGTSLAPEVVAAPAAQAGGDGAPWALIAAGGGGAAVLAAVVVLVRRRRGAAPRIDRPAEAA